MPLSLSSLARMFLSNEAAARREIVVPVLVHETPPLDDEEELLLGTAIVTREVDVGRSGEGLAFLIEKRQVNAFPMGVTVGRTENNDVCLTDNTVSRFHGWFQQSPSGDWLYFDANSKIGTWVNGERLASGAPFAMPAVARIRFGTLELFYLTPESLFEYLQGHLRP